MLSTRLDREVDPARDHVLGDARAADHPGRVRQLCLLASVAQPTSGSPSLRDQLGDRLRYVFRHRPLTRQRHRAARRGACGALSGRRRVLEGARRADDALAGAHGGRRCEPSRASSASTPDVRALRREGAARARGCRRAQRERERRDVHADVLHQRPALRRALGRQRRSRTRCSARSATRIRAAALDFAGWAPSAGVLLLLMSILAVVLTNSDVGPGFHGVLGAHRGDLQSRDSLFQLPLLALGQPRLAVRFLPGRRARDQARVHGRPPRAACVRRPCRSPLRSAAWSCRPLIYSLLVPHGPWAHGWGVPMATDTAFAVALIACWARACRSNCASS